jgi:hypothetical protein
VRLAFVVSLLIVASCSNRGTSPPAAPVDVNIADIGDASAPLTVVPAAKRPPQARCTAQLSVVGELVRAPTCNVDAELAAGAPGTLAYPCGGEGTAEARFGKERLSGTISGGYLRLEIKTNPDWHDGCGWESRQLVEGQLRDRRLAWTYDESLLENRGNCYSPCGATATIEIEPEE